MTCVEEKIKSLFSGNQGAGQHKATWTGVDDYGLNVSAGVYIYKLEVSDKVFKRKNDTNEIGCFKKNFKCRGGGIGRHARFRIWCT